MTTSNYDPDLLNDDIADVKRERALAEEREREERWRERNRLVPDLQRRG